MRTTRHPIRYVLSFVGMGLMLAGLFGGPVLRRHLRQTWNHSSIRMIGGIRIPMGISILGDSKIIGGSVTAGGNRIVGDTGMIGRPEDQGTACPITTPFTKARSARCSARASGAAASIHAANTGANVQEGEPG